MPSRVLLVVGGLHEGGIQSWIMTVARRVPADQVRLTFLVHTPGGRYADEAVALGHSVVVVPRPHALLAHARAFGAMARATGPYDAVHSFVGHYSAFVLLLARRAGIGVRLAHSQSDRRREHGTAGAVRRAVLGLTRRLLDATMTRGLACSREAAWSLFGRDRGRPPVEILPNAIDAAAVAGAPALGRVELGVPSGRPVVAHVGRFAPVKNQAWLVEVAARWRERGDEIQLALVGDGPEREEVERLVAEAGLSEAVTFLGQRNDVPSILRSVDALALPSLHEGVPIVLLEAQAAGLPCVVSDVVTEAADVDPELVRRLSLDEGPDAWADALAEAVRRPRPPAADMPARFAAAGYDLDHVVARLRALWAGGD